MYIRKRTASAMLAFALVLPVHTAAQQQREIDPQPLASDHPNARRAAAVVERIIAGDRAGAVEVLRREGDPDSSPVPWRRRWRA